MEKLLVDDYAPNLFGSFTSVQSAQLCPARVDANRAKTGNCSGKNQLGRRRPSSLTMKLTRRPDVSVAIPSPEDLRRTPHQIRPSLRDART